MKDKTCHLNIELFYCNSVVLCRRTDEDLRSVSHLTQVICKKSLGCMKTAKVSGDHVYKRKVHRAITPNKVQRYLKILHVVDKRQSIVLGYSACTTFGCNNFVASYIH